MSRLKTVIYFSLPVILSFILHYWVFDLEVVGYHVWRQTQTQTVIYNFSFSDNSIFNPQRFDLSSGTATLLYEFPLYQWLIAQYNNLAGYAVVHTRVITFLFFTFFLAGFFLLVRKFVNVWVALLANICVCFSPVLFYYCVNPLPDILALAFAVWAMNFFFDFLGNKKTKSFILFSLCLCLAALVKLPYILFGAGGLYYFYRELRAKNYLNSIIKSTTWLLFLVPVFIWYARAIPTWNTNKVGLGISANTKTLAELFDYFQSNLISSMPELVANYGACLFLFLGFYLFFKGRKWGLVVYKYLMVLFIFCCLYFFYELNMIERTHDYYLLPFVPFIFLVITSGINFLYLGKYRWMTFVLVFFIPLLGYLRIHHRWDPSDPGFNKNYMIYSDHLKKILPPESICIVDHDDSKYIALYYLKRKGYSLYENEMNPLKLESLFAKGANYLVTEDPKFDTLQHQKLAFDLLFSEELKLYKIKSR